MRVNNPCRWYQTDFHAFVAVLGIEGNLDSQISLPIQRGGVDVRLGWVPAREWRAARRVGRP